MAGVGPDHASASVGPRPLHGASGHLADALTKPQAT